MPWQVAKVKGGYQVKTKATGRTHSRKPLSKKTAEAQMRALYAREKSE